MGVRQQQRRDGRDWLEEDQRQQELHVQHGQQPDESRPEDRDLRALMGLRDWRHHADVQWLYAFRQQMANTPSFHDCWMYPQHAQQVQYMQHPLFEQYHEYERSPR